VTSPLAGLGRRVLEDPAEIPEAHGCVDALGHRGGLKAGRAAASADGVVGEERRQRRAKAAPPGLLHGRDVVDPAVVTEIEGHPRRHAGAVE